MSRIDPGRLKRWLDKLSVLPDTPVAESLYRLDTREGQLRRANLEEYFRRLFRQGTDILLVGEAPGYQGSRRTGVPFASEHILLGGMPEIEFFSGEQSFQRVFQDEREYKEPTGTIMWRTINRCARLPLLWSAYPLHPHQAGNPESNRTPTRAEVLSVQPLLLELIEITNTAKVLALGNVAKQALDQLGIPAQKLRHPAHGGARLFEQQIRELLPQKANTS